MSNAAVGDHVRLRVEGRLAAVAGQPAESDEAILEFTVGRHDVAEQLERAIVGMAPGEEKQILVGPRRPPDGSTGRRLSLPRSALPADFDLALGRELQTPATVEPSGTATIVEISDDAVTLDTNGPVGGGDVLLRLTLLGVAEGTPV